MRLLTVIFLLTLTEGRRQRQDTLHAAPETLTRNSRANDDGYPKSFGGSVDFGHVYRDGVRNPSAKYHDDVLETDMRPVNLEQARRLLKKVGSDVNWMEPRNQDPKGFFNPRDAILYWMKRNESSNNFMIDQGDGYFSKSSNDTFKMKGVKTVAQPKSKAMEEKTMKELLEKAKHLPQQNIKDPDRPKYQYFSRSGFELISDETRYKGNWTTCKEFANGAVFHPDDIIHLEWLPFYIWSTRNFVTAFVHVFSYPTKKLVQHYKDKLGPFLNIKVDWEQPKLLLKESKDLLMIAGDRKGLFYGIPYIELPLSFKHSKDIGTQSIIRYGMPTFYCEEILIWNGAVDQTNLFEIVDPYIAMMYCDERYAAIMAVAGTEPETDQEKIAEAVALRFIGIGHPANRDLALERHRAQYEKERKLKEEKMKYIDIEQPVNAFDASQW